jgi:hypothetical protein
MGTEPVAVEGLVRVGPRGLAVGGWIEGAGRRASVWISNREPTRKHANGLVLKRGHGFGRRRGRAGGPGSREAFHFFPLIPAKAGTHAELGTGEADAGWDSAWVPAFAGMSGG